jgi:hypothetical protein
MRNLLDLILDILYDVIFIVSLFPFPFLNPAFHNCTYNL